MHKNKREEKEKTGLRGSGGPVFGQKSNMEKGEARAVKAERSYPLPSALAEEDENGENPSAAGASPEERLRQLQSLYDQRLITTEEYEQKRQEILKEL